MDLNSLIPGRYFRAVCFLAIGFVSCTGEVKYRVSFENRTNYRLDSLIVGGKDGIVLTLLPGNKSDSIEVSRGVWSVSEPFLGIWVRSYSDSDSAYSNSIGHMISFSSLEEGVINRIIVTEDRSSGNEPDIFKFTPGR